MTSLVEARGVGIAGRLSPTDLAIKAGTMVAVIGPNGGGKTSLLRSLARTEDAVGTVTIDGQEVDATTEAQRRRLLAFLPAAREATWPVTVADTLKFGLGVPDSGRIDHLIGLLELERLAARPIDRLSTGERARAMLGRAIAGRARLLLLDEPLSNLDPYWVLRTIEIVRGEVTSSDSAALVSVHDLGMAKRFDRVLLVSNGAITADDYPEAVLGSDRFKTAFRVERSDHGWAISPASADPRSLP
ncbi:MAG: ABC transporter ATP-binding protein [Sphingomonas bacterium]|nr:ABC transporter ATP-binding protein [Sphingomonas bacterium]